MTNGCLMGIDHGIKRIGVAISDSLWLVAREYTIIERRSKREDFERLNQIIEEHEVTAIVAGLPSDLDAPEGTYTQADTVRLWVSRFSQTTTLPIVMWDEQFTSEDAHMLGKAQKRGFRDPIDDLAARLILQSYMDALRDGLATNPISS